MNSMNNTEKQLRSILSKMEKSKQVIAKERDFLRSSYEELEALVESLDRGVACIENGKRDIEDGIDALSELL